MTLSNFPKQSSIISATIRLYQTGVGGQCQAWIRKVYSHPYVNLQNAYKSGATAWQCFLSNRGKGWAFDYYTGQNIPNGACVWWKPKGQGGYGGASGHVGIFINGMVYDSNFSAREKVGKRPLSQMKQIAGWGWCVNPQAYNLPTDAGMSAGNFSYSVDEGMTITDYDEVFSSAFGDDSVQSVEENSYNLKEIDRYEINVEGRQTFEPVEEKYQLTVNGYDVTDYASEIELSEDINELSTVFTFKLPFEPKDSHIYLQFKEKVNAKVGDWVYWRNDGNKQRDKELFRGIITNITNDWQITCNDVGWYLNKTEVFFQANNISSKQAVENLLKTAFPQGSGLAIETGYITNYLQSTINKTWIGETPAEILKYILGQNQEEKGVNFLYKVRKNKLNIDIYPTILTVVKVRQVGGGAGVNEDLGYFDCTWLLEGVSGNDNIDDLKNKVVAVAKNSSTGNSLVEAKDNDSISKYARLQKIVELTDTDVNKGVQFVKSTLKESNVVKQERTVQNMLGHDAVISGLIMEFSSKRYGLEGYWLVKKVTQKYYPYHSMSLELINVVKPTADKSQVIVNEQNFAELQSQAEITDDRNGLVNIDSEGWATAQASAYSPDDAGNITADGTPFNWNTNCVAVGMKSGDWQRYKGKHIYISYNGKTVESVVRDVGNFGAGGKYTNRKFDLSPAVWKQLGGLQDHQQNVWGVRTIKYKYKD